MIRLNKRCDNVSTWFWNHPQGSMDVGCIHTRPRATMSSQQLHAMHDVQKNINARDGRCLVGWESTPQWFRGRSVWVACSPAMETNSGMFRGGKSVSGDSYKGKELRTRITQTTIWISSIHSRRFHHVQLEMTKKNIHPSLSWYHQWSYVNLSHITRYRQIWKTGISGGPRWQPQWLTFATHQRPPGFPKAYLLHTAKPWTSQLPNCQGLLGFGGWPSKPNAALWCLRFGTTGDDTKSGSPEPPPETNRDIREKKHVHCLAGPNFPMKHDTELGNWRMRLVALGLHIKSFFRRTSYRLWYSYQQTSPFVLP